MMHHIAEESQKLPASATKPQSERILFIDLLRIIACFLVIVNHTNSRIFMEHSPSLTWFLSLSYFFLCKVAVPVFIMISGYTMLDHVDTHRKAFIRLIRCGCALFLFSTLYYLNDCFSGVYEKININEFFVIILNKPVTTAFWYMYLYLGILLMLPYLQKLASVVTKQDLQLLFFWSALFFSLWPIAVHFKPSLTLSKEFSVPLFSSSIALLFFGFYFKKYCFPSRKWRLPCLAGYLLSVGLNVFLTYKEYLKFHGHDYLFFDDRYFFPIVFGAVCLFGFVATLDIRRSIKKLVVLGSKLTFGIYLLSDLIIDKLEFIYNLFIEQGFPPMPAMILYEFAVFTVCACLVYVLRKLPVLRKLL